MGKCCKSYHIHGMFCDRHIQPIHHNKLNRQGLDKTASGLRQLPVFNHTHGTISQVRKTGLGSSAAMTTSVVASLLAHFGLVYLSKDGLNSNDISTTADDRLEATPLSMLYNLAQTCHCVAQGKVGSGFDISAAVIGTHGYRRFSPEILDPVFRASEILAAHVGDVDKDTYCGIGKIPLFQLPPGLGLMLGDVAAGSNTPKLVSMVLAWRKANSDQALALWIKIDGLNSEILSAFRELCDYARSTNESTHCGVSYLEDMAICSEIPAASWKSLLEQNKHKSSDTIHKLVSIHSIHQEIRECLRKMSEMSGAPIEPIEQTRLLDACMKVPGVLMGGVPGGQYSDPDFALELLYLIFYFLGPLFFVSDVARDGVCKVWHSWTEMEVVPLLQGESQNGLRCSKIPLQDL
ncbi:phosphomevalonate kinase [Batrachochytrium salamandrivorans]|nr:phosphomevalonate kinase [Batrachochytrium salamandrivorans]